MVDILIEDVPDEVMEMLSRRAAAMGQSLESYVREHLIEAITSTRSE